MLTIFQVSSTLRHEKVHVTRFAPSPGDEAPRDWHVTIADSSPRAMSQDENVSGVQRLL